MPVARYFLFVGVALLALLFLADQAVPKLPVAESAQASTDKPIIRIRSDRKWPERVVFDTSIPTIVPVQTAKAQTSVPVPASAAIADVAPKPRALESFAQLKPPEPKKPEHKRRIARARIAPPVILVAQQPRFGLFDNNAW